METPGVPERPREPGPHRHLIRRFRTDDAAAARAVFYAAVRIGAAGHYTEAELAEWAPSPEMSDDWGPWLDRHITLVSETGGRVTGFMMLEADGYLNMAFVLPEYRRSGLADALYDAILAEARTRAMPRLTVWASRLAQRFLARRGWQIDPAPPPHPDHPAPTQGGPEPMSLPMLLDPVTP